MQERLLDYLLGDLDERERSEVEAALLEDAELRAKLERLRGCLDATGLEPTPPETRLEPPRDLAKRTCAYVAGATDDPWTVAPLQGHLSESPGQMSAETSWSTTDLAVTAGIVLATAMFFMPALQESRFLARRNQCQANLMNLAKPIMNYAQIHNGVIPDGTRFRNQHGRNRFTAASRVSGGDVPFLMVSDDVLDPQLAFVCVVCPDSYLADDIRRRGSPLRMPSRREYLAARQQSLSDFHRRIGGSLAYRIGHDGPRGYEPWRIDGSRYSPVISDAPGGSGPFLQSDNHRGIGMNVLFADGSVDFITGCPSLACGDKLFLNNNHCRAPGVDRRDAVLVGGNETIDVGRTD